MAHIATTLYTKNFERTGWLSDPAQITCTLRHNNIGETRVTIPLDHPKLSLLMAKGARAVIELVPDEGPREFLMSGPVTARHLAGPSSSGTGEFTITDDFHLLAAIFGFPSPTNATNTPGPIPNQGASKTHKVTGPAETVVKTFVTANMVTRLGMPVTVPATEGRGETITVAMRMHPLIDRLFPAVDQAGIGVAIRQQGTGWLLDVYEPQTYKRVLSEEGGAILTYQYDELVPEANRGIGGDGQESTTRSFRLRRNTQAETDWGYPAETFVDSNDTDTNTEMDAAIDEALKEADPLPSLSVTLAETDTFKYGGPNGIRLGDKVTVRLATTDGTVTDTIRQCELDWTADTGLLITPSMGETPDTPDAALSKTLRDFSTDIRALKRR